ncbi:MAG: TonB-dependent receptor [Bacteroidales bacterium]|nr:TonB-dependent receptor [Bacteroidales bacterium]
MKTYKIIILISVLLFHTTFMYGQSQYDIEVRSAFNPSIKDAQTKISLPAKITDTSNIQQEIKYDIEDMVLTHEFVPEPINAPKVGKDQIVRLYRNYIKVGFGYPEPYLEFSHSNLRSKKFAYGVNVKHHSFFGKIKSYGPASYSHSELNGYGQWFLKNFILEGEVGYNHDFVHCYGYNTDSLKKLYSIKDMHLPKAKTTVRQYHNAYAGINAISNYGKRSSSLSQLYSLDYNFLYDNFKSYEHQLAFASSLLKPIEIPRLDFAKIGGDIGVNYFHNNWVNKALKEDNWLFDINPKLEMVYGNYAFHIGFKVAVGLRDSSVFGIYPDIEALMNVVPNILTFYVGVGGDMSHYSYLESMQMNPYLSDYLNLGFINELLQIYAGTKTNLSRSLTFGARASLGLVNNMPFFFNDTAASVMLKDTSVNLFNTFVIVNSQSVHTNAHVDLTYRYKEIVEVVLNFDYNLYTADSIIKKAWYKPMFTTSLDAFYNLKDKFIFNFGFYIHTGAYRPSVTPSGAIRALPLKAIFDFNLGCEYRWNKRLSFFLDVNNFAAQRNFYYYEYPSERINFLVGAKYIFGGEKIGKK